VLSFTRRSKKTRFQDGTKKRAVLYVYSFYDDCASDKRGGKAEGFEKGVLSYEFLR
jgi:hypothetical protein